MAADITKKFVRDMTGKEEYEFGDLTKSAVKAFTGKDEYKFGGALHARGSDRPAPWSRTDKTHTRTETPCHMPTCLLMSIRTWRVRSNLLAADITKTLGQKFFGNKDVKKKP